jgi:hypothetical protein
MGLILLEALGALLLLVLIVWWTMFSGRKGGEPPAREDGGVPTAAPTRKSERKVALTQHQMVIVCYICRSKLASSTADLTSILSNTRARCTSTVRTLMSS